MAESQISARASTALVASVGSGAIAALLGIYSCVAFANHQMSLGADDERGVIWPGEVALIDGRALAIAALTLATILFTALAGFAFLMRARREVRFVVLAIAIVDAAVVAGILVSSWEYGWRFILDHNAARPFVMMTGLQTIAFLAAGVLGLVSVSPEDTSRSPE
ncbi:MAG: hypothetical protein KIT31_16155 [Deltaproteobacteria bacterium]|nr:hypothetical protein [Deltaproteobacteria bacterium]